MGYRISCASLVWPLSINLRSGDCFGHSNTTLCSVAFWHECVKAQGPTLMGITVPIPSCNIFFIIEGRIFLDRPRIKVKTYVY